MYHISISDYLTYSSITKVSIITDSMTTETKVYPVSYSQDNQSLNPNSTIVNWDKRYELDSEHYCKDTTTGIRIEDYKGKTIDGFGTPSIDLSPLGTMKISIKPVSKNGTKLVSWSEANRNWHIKSGRNSQLPISLKISEITIPDGTFFVRLTLVRRNKDYQEIPVDVLCDKHAYPNDLEDKLRVIQPSHEFDGIFWYSSGARRSLCIACTKPENGCIMADIIIKLICMDTCQNSSMNDKIREGARDLVLVATLERRDSFLRAPMIIARNNVPIWPKKLIAKREFFKPVRRLPKGTLSRKQMIKPHGRIMVNETLIKFEWLCKNITVVGLSLGLSKHDILRRVKQFQELLSTE